MLLCQPLSCPKSEQIALQEIRPEEFAISQDVGLQSIPSPCYLAAGALVGIKHLSSLGYGHQICLFPLMVRIAGKTIVADRAQHPFLLMWPPTLIEAANEFFRIFPRVFDIAGELLCPEFIATLD